MFHTRLTNCKDRTFRLTRWARLVCSSLGCLKVYEGGGGRVWSLDGVGEESGEELCGVAVELFYHSAVVVKVVECDPIQLFLVEGLCYFQFSGVLVLDGFLEDFDHSDDPVVGWNGRRGCCELQDVGEVADVTVVCGPCASVAVWL